MANCSSSLGPAVPVMSVPLCLSTNTAVDSLPSPFGLVALKLPDHFPVTSRSAVAAPARAASTRKHRSVLICSPSEKVDGERPQKFHFGRKDAEQTPRK